MSRKKYILVLLIFISLQTIFAQQAEITEVSGTVEVKYGRSGDWGIVRAGTHLQDDAWISTGFRSYATLKTGNTIITIQPLTRLTVLEIKTTAGAENINMNLQTGRIRVDVDAPAGSRGSAVFNTPSAVASVRGTVFELDTINLTVIEGTVEFAGKAGVPVLIDAGRSSFVDERNDRAISSEKTFFAELSPSLPITSANVTATEAINARNMSVKAESAPDIIPDTTGGIDIGIGF